MKHATCAVLMMIGCAGFAGSATVDPCGQPVVQAEPVFFDVGDINADGVLDVAVAEPFLYASESPSVAILSGADGAPVLQFAPPAGARYFGMGIGRVPDLDDDGVADLAVACLVADTGGAPVAVLHVYSALNGQPIAVVTKQDDTPLTPADVRLVGDLDADRAVGVADLSVLLDYIDGQGTISDQVLADVDHNGIVEFDDGIALVDRAGSVLDVAKAASFVTELNTLWTLAEPVDLEGTQLGLFGCAWCWIRCLGAMNQAANCADICRAAYDACRNKPTVWEECECLADVRRNCMPNCLAQVANVAGRCGSCVWKCAPRPSYR